MATTYSSSRRRAGFAIALLVMILGLPRLASAQSSAPLVSANSPIGLNHPTGWGTIEQTAIDANGNWLVNEYAHSGLFEFPANGGPMITLVPLGGLGSGYQNPAVLIDPANNLYLGGNWNNCLLEFPYDSTSQTWNLLGNVTTSSPSPDECNGNNNPPSFAQYSLFTSVVSKNYFQPWGIATGNNNNLILSSQNGVFIFSLPIQGAWSNPVAATGTVPGYVIDGLTARPNSIAVNPEGDIFFVEDPSANPAGLPGVFEIPAGSTGLSTDAGLTRVDPNLPNVTGVITDPSGNLYISDGTDGVFVVPNSSGTVETSAAYQVSAIPAQGEVAIDWARNVLYVPTTQTQSNGQADVAKVNLGYAELGASTVSTATANSIPVSYAFNGSVTPASFVIVEDGVSKPDFALTGGTCTPGTAYALGNSCTESVSMTPHSVGSISAKLLMLDSKSNVLSSFVLHGTGTGALMQASPALESNIGASGSLSTPSQVTVDGQGNVYVADAGKGAVLMYAAGSSAAAKSIGNGLTAPTGVAVDGAGDVFIADSGNVYEVPFGPSGLNASGQAKLASGLGSNLRLAADGLGNLYVADPSNARVVKLGNLGQTGPTLVAQSETMMTAGFTAPSAVAVDSNNNLYAIDGSNLLEVVGGLGAPTTLLNTLNGATGVAVDASGAVYISSPGGTERIPLVSGALVPGSATSIAATITNPTSIALDQSSNVYVTDGSAEDVHAVNVNGSLTFAPFTSLNQAAVLPTTVTNTGNASLTVTSYTATYPIVDSVSVVNFTAADGNCEANSPVAAGGSCEVTVTLNPGPGEQGPLSSQIALNGNSAYPTVIDVAGTGAPLASSNAKLTVSSSGQAISTPITINVSAQNGGTMPTGQVAVTYTSWQAKLLACPNAPVNCGPVPVPVTETITGTLNGPGVSSFNLSPIMAGTQTITIEYIGDRTYGRSTMAVNATIAKSQITSLALDPNPPSYLPYVLEQDGSTPYDGSQSYWQYNLPVSINTAAGVPTGTITFMDNSLTCPPGTSATGQGAAICALASYSGAACPQLTSSSLLSGNGIQFIVNSGTNSTSAAAQFSTSCLQMLQNTTYTPVISTHYITPVYSGDANFQGFTGTAPQLFQVLRSPLVTITSAPSTLTVQSGSSASTTLTLTSLLGYGYAGKGGQLNDYNFPVTLTCDNLPPHSECSFTYPSTVNANQPTAPNSVQIPCSGTTAAADNCLPGTVTMTINTNIAVGTTTSRNAAVASVTLASIFGLGMLSLFFRRRAFAKAGWLPMIVLMIVGCGLAISLSACSTTNLTPQAQLSSPSGTYAVTVTAQQVGSIVLNEPGVGEVNVYGSENQVSLPFYVNVTVQ